MRRPQTLLNTRGERLHCSQGLGIGEYPKRETDRERKRLFGENLSERERARARLFGESLSGNNVHNGGGSMLWCGRAGERKRDGIAGIWGDREGGD